MNLFSRTASALLCGLCLLTLCLTSTSCGDEDPGITNIRLCELIPDDENVCEDDTNSISQDVNTVSISCDLDGAEENDLVTFTLFLDTGAELLEAGEFSQRLDVSGNNVIGNATFIAPDRWGVGDWEIEIQLETEIPVTATKRYRTE